ncbi:MAG: peptidase M28 [Sphingomonas sanxanigenens]|uniref:Peptidase M28 n=1 Tax=Sphingomonas sanxanigenens TaxID=397260 RepID=A0A2W5CB74_9SPHN|nr:MAG: peptidase M28 [Sphingomonas sanxanigenens]
MRIVQTSLAAIAVCASAAVAAQGATDLSPLAERFKSHVAFLADDLLEGRDIGSRGHEIAALYVATRFEGMGLKPGGDKGGWYQRITFQRTSRSDTPGSVTISGPAGSRSWKHATDVTVSLNPLDPDVDVSAPLVFVGYGIQDKALGIDDYRGLDVKGKIVVTLSGFPKGMPSEEGAHLSASKDVTAARHGAIGTISIATIQSEKARPWARSVQFASNPRVNWVDANGRPHVDAPAIRGSAALNTPAAEAAFAGAPKALKAVLAEADKTGGRPRGFALKTSARIVNSAKIETITSPNVVGILPGSDPSLAAQYVVLSAHLDHIGISPAQPDDKPGTDRINNGALDNAAGIATMLEVARTATSAPTRPRRSIIFVASTGEEKGLLGADYYARHPSVPISQIVGNVDLDMPLLLYPFTDVIAFGADHSTLGKLVADAVAPMDIKLSPDPMPQESIFVRSDHYMFVRQGVPAVFLATGFANGGEAAWGSFLSGNYHHPGDDMSQKIDWQAAARFTEANYRITRAMADADQAPEWYQGDYFGNLFAPERTKAAK